MDLEAETIKQAKREREANAGATPVKVGRVDAQDAPRAHHTGFPAPGPKHYIVECWGSDAENIGNMLAMDGQPTIHICNQKFEACKNGGCPLMKTPVGTCHHYIQKGWCRFATRKALEPSNTELTGCAAKLHCVCIVGPTGPCFYPVKDPATPLWSTGLTQKSADDLSRQTNSMKRELEKARAIKTAGSIGVAAPCLAMTGIREEEEAERKEVARGEKTSRELGEGRRGRAQDAKDNVESAFRARELERLGKEEVKVCTARLAALQRKPRPKR